MVKNRSHVISALLIIIVGFAVYSNSLSNEFLWDDELLILRNDYIKDLKNIPGLFTRHIAYGTATKSNLYRPLQMLTYALNYAGWKLDLRAYHLTNIAIHILAALMFYWLAHLLCKDALFSLVSALLFITHPIHTEAVTYISGRADPLACLFMLTCAIFFIKYAQEAKKGFYFLSLVSFLLALLSKEIAIVVPLLLFAYVYFYKGKKGILLKRSVPFFLLGLLYVVLRKTILNFPINKTVIDQVSFSQRLGLIFKSLTMYFQNLLLPLNLHMEYELIVPPTMDRTVILGIALAAMLILVALRYRRRRRLISFSIAWFLINYLPVSNVYPLNAFFAEHWIYTPSLGLFLLLGWMAIRLSAKGRIFKHLTYAVLTFLLAANFYLTSKQNQYWRNPEYFYQRTLAYTSQSARVYYRLALFYFRKGRLEESIEKSIRALEITPTYIPAYENLSSVYIVKGWDEKTIELCTKALFFGPDSFVLRNNLGIAYSAKERYPEAISQFKQAIAINPNYAKAYCNLGNTYARIGKTTEAITAFKRALEIKPDYALASRNLARLYDDMKRKGE